jgi:hypothetical protein
VPALDPFKVWARQKRNHSVGGRQLFSPLSFFLGPYEGPSSITGADEFFRKTNV